MSLNEKHKISEGLFLVHPTKYEAGSISDRELDIRKKAVITILDIYTAINNNHTPKSDFSPSFSHLNRVPGWRYTPVYPSKMRSTYPSITIDKAMDKFEYLETPEFDKPLKAALAGLSVRSGWKTECTSAMQFAQYAVWDSLFPEYLTNYMITTPYLDEMISKNPEAVTAIKGYDGLNDEILKERVAAGLFTKEVSDQMILDTKDAQRRHMLDILINQLVYRKTPTDNIIKYELMFPGDILYIYGHPNYLTKFPYGAYRGENVFFVGYSAEGDRLFMGFGDNFMSPDRRANPRKLKEIQIWLALNYAIGALTYPEIDKKRYADEVDSIMTTRALPAGASDFAKAFFTIRTGANPIVLHNLNIATIIKEATGGNRKKQKRSRRSKQSRRKRSTRRR